MYFWKMSDYDFYIQEEYRGKRTTLPRGMPDWPEEPIELIIPIEACYLDVNPLEEDEEFQGCQDECGRRQLNYYDKNEKYISSQDLEHKIVTWRLMSRLEHLLKKQY